MFELDYEGLNSDTCLKINFLIKILTIDSKNLFLNFIFN